MLSRMESTSVTCMTAFVNRRVRIRYNVERSRAAAVTRSSRYTVCLQHDSANSAIEKRLCSPIQSN
jgi:hypothetical protein